MKRRSPIAENPHVVWAASQVARVGISLALSASVLSLFPVHAADAPAPSGPAVVLPPMLIEESTSSAPWLYANVQGTEFLSRCSRGTTEQFIDSWLAKMQLMHVLVPEEFMVRTDVPAICVLYSQDLSQTMSAEIQRELTAAQQAKGESSDGSRINLAPNMRLSDRDMHATIVYIDEAEFMGAQLGISASHVRYLLQGRVPELPGWLLDGFERVWRGADFSMVPITLSPVIWLDETESSAIGSDSTRPRALLPASELFAPDSQRARETQHPRRVRTRTSEQELFVRWALSTSKTTREALWKFVARASDGPVTEEIFEACFGFDYAELRDRLSDYLPTAVETTKRIAPGTLPPLPRYELELATSDQIARVRGEWERLAIWHVQNRLPQAREPYIAQARRTMHRAYDAGDRDPRLLAIMGLCEINSGHPEGAREFLEPAIAGGVVRPSAYYEVARLRFAELRRGMPETQRIPVADLVPIIRPLQRTLTQAPPLPEIFTLLAEAWTCCETPPNADELAELKMGARLFARRPMVGLPIAQALAQHGKKAEAAAVLDGCAGYPADEKTLAGISRLRADLGLDSTRPPPAQ